MVQDSRALSGADQALWYPGQWSTVSAVSEPSSATLMLGGLSLLGGSLQQRFNLRSIPRALGG